MLGENIALTRIGMRDRKKGANCAHVKKLDTWKRLALRFSLTHFSSRINYSTATASKERV